MEEDVSKETIEDAEEDLETEAQKGGFDWKGLLFGGFSLLKTSTFRSKAVIEEAGIIGASFGLVILWAMKSVLIIGFDKL
ncbi:MAG: hypothetical protein QMD53_02100 [Actinomycetota bacterium]|nr:hypothetical protein [Actinomycetota bacterium]